MKEIKFRAWDSYKNEMVDYEFIMDSNGNALMTQYGEIVASLTNYKLMQYTGLKDKNGKEIYEGDIIQYQDTINNGYRDVSVTRNAEVSFGLGMFWGGYGYNLASIRKEAEVIGNIYQGEDKP